MLVWLAICISFSVALESIVGQRIRTFGLFFIVFFFCKLVEFVVGQIFFGKTKT